jgi:hypothetical protein
MPTDPPPPTPADPAYGALWLSELWPVCHELPRWEREAERDQARPQPPRRAA